MSEVRAVKHRGNRAVAALTEATSHVPTLLPDLRDAGGGGFHRPIVRYPRFSELERARREQDPLAADRQALADLQEQPKPRDELGALPEAAMRDVLEYAGGCLSVDGAALAAVCKATRQASLTQSRGGGGEAVVVELVPSMLPSPAALARPGVLRALTAYLATNKRGHVVSSLSLVQSRYYAATASQPAAPPVLSLPPTLQLVSQLTYLRSLDLRGVAWDGAPDSLPCKCFLADLHLVAPRLHSLKVGSELCRHWAAGWWQRHTDLCVLVIGSRWGEAAGCHAPTAPRPALLHLDADFFAMLASEQRRWRVKLWSRLTRDSALRLLGISGGSSAGAAAAATAGSAPPPAGGPGAGTSPAGAAGTPLAFSSLAELCINLQGNTDVCEWLAESDGGGGTTGADANGAGGGDSARSSSQQRAKGKRGAATEAAGDTPLFPSLTTLTIANVEERVMSSAEVLGRFYVLAPSLTSFNVCNTTRRPPPERSKGPKKEKPTAADGA